MDMKKVAFVVLVAAVCMTAVMAASKPPQPKAVVDAAPKTGASSPSKGDAPAPAPTGDASPSASAVTVEAPSSTSTSTAGGSLTLPGDALPTTAKEAPAPAPSSANTVVGSLAGASLVSFLALYM